MESTEKTFMHKPWNELSPEEKEAKRKEGNRIYNKGRRDMIARMSPEEREQYHSNRKYDKEQKQREREEKLKVKEQKILSQRELAILQFMVRTNIIFYHHGEEESLTKEVLAIMQELKEQEHVLGAHLEYNSYIWNYQGEGKNYMSRCLLGRLWRSSTFETIYDVPLDGTYYFYCYDSGERGSGSFGRITCAKEGEGPKVPKVNPGGFPQITAR